MAERSVWSGAISFGLVTVPVKLHTAVTPKTVKFNQLNGATGNRIRQPKVDVQTGDEVAFQNIIKGYELAPGRYVTVTPEELDSVAPKKSKTISIEEFVPADQINPLAYDKSYFVAPDEDAGDATKKAYRLLARIMREGDNVAIGKVVMRAKEYLVALRTDDNGVLTMSTMVFADEVKSSDRVVEIDDSVEPTEAEVAQGQILVNAMLKDWDHSEFVDTHRQQVLEMIEKKAAGEEIKVDEQGPAPASPDLMGTLEASLAAVGKAKAKGQKSPAKKTSKAAPKRAKKAA